MYSDIVKKGLEKTPHRSLFKASGFTDEEIERPLIGVVSAKNEIIPGHIHLDKIAEAVKTGVRIAGGTPLEFPAIGVCYKRRMSVFRIFFKHQQIQHRKKENSYIKLYLQWQRNKDNFLS